MVDDDAVLRRVAAGGLIEDPDEMSQGYLDHLKHLLLVCADTELMGACFYHAYLVAQPVPATRAKAVLALIQDELGHANVAYRLLQDLGETPDDLVYRRPIEAFRYPFAMDMPIENWHEVAVVGAFMDRAGAILLTDVFEHTSYGPWKRSLVKVMIEEQFHTRFGESNLRQLAVEPDSRRLLQRAVDWMFPVSVEWFGVPDRLKTGQAQLTYRLKALTNDQLRQQWLSQVVPLCEQVGVRVPAHLDRESGAYVLDYPFPCAFDPGAKRWDMTREESWDEVKRRWQSRGPLAKTHAQRLLTGHRSLAAGAPA